MRFHLFLFILVIKNRQSCGGLVLFNKILLDIFQINIVIVDYSLKKTIERTVFLLFQSNIFLNLFAKREK